MSSNPQELKISEVELLPILDGMMEGCQIIGFDFRYLYVNETVVRHGRTTKENLLGKTMMEVYPGIEKTKMFSVLQRCMKERSQAQLENEFEYPDGQKGWFVLRFLPVPHGVFIMSIDIAERKAAEKELKESLKKARTILGGIIHVVGSMVGIKDPYTYAHQRRVSDLARSIAKEMNLPFDKTEGVRVAGVIHDIGKIGLPSDILSKPGHLNDIEFILIKQHPQIGYDILKNIEFPWQVAEIVYQHHERLDGSGYPRGLSKDMILQEAKILSVADVVEAMSSHRPYRPTLGMDKALEEISNKRGILYDPEAVDVCLKLINEKGYEFRYTESGGLNTPRS